VSQRKSSGPATPAVWGSLSRERIVQAARAILDRDGYERITIRGIAAELGVAPMSLYRHVRDKDDLLDEIVDRMFADQWRPRSTRVNWRTWLVEVSERFREFLVTQPAALHVYLQHPVVSPTALDRMAEILDVLQDAGADAREADRAYAALHTYTIGFAALEAARTSAGRSETAGKDGSPSRLARRLASYTSRSQFQVGIGYLIDGVSARLEQR
jgi:AcrR family transcriptional regulator